MVTKDAATNLKTSAPKGAGPYGSRGDSSQVEPFVDPATNPAVLKQQDYAELKRRIVAAGLLEKQPGYYFLNAAIRLALLGTSIAILFVIDILWLQLLNAVFLAFALTQLGYLGHDAGHRQIFRTAQRNDTFGLGINFLLGISRTWWVDTHNEHHVDPNDLERDPHTLLPIFAFSEEQARNKEGFLRRIIGYQGFYFFPILLLENVGTRLASIQFLVAREVRGKRWEASLMVVHFAVYFGLLFSALTWWHAVLFIVVHQSLQGLYMGSVFAPNHKGMPMTDGTEQWDSLLRQVLPTRNVTGGWLIDFIMGGLNLQIPHHIDSLIPRCNLKRANEICRNFCKAHGITYCEESVWKSYYLIFAFLHQISSVLRKKPVAS
ncbi:MAG: acyl-CoA desaturase [Chloroflexi bacterium]|nr:acyl-CoA desaturase [Chloroflexota bacterium]